MIRICKFKNGWVALKHKKSLKNNFKKKVNHKMIQRIKMPRKQKRIMEHGKNFSQTSLKNAKVVKIRKILKNKSPHSKTKF